MKTAFMLVPGGLGDLVICGPIAEFYSKLGYTIYWPARKQFIPTLLRFPYVKPILLSEEVLHSDWLRSDVMKAKQLSEYQSADLILDLADRGDWQEQRSDENFEQFKFRKAGVPFEYKHHLNWTRNYKKEEDLKVLVCPAGEYVFAHLGSSHGDRAEMPPEEKRFVVEAREIEGFDIFDWFGVIQNSSDIYCVESCFQCLVDSRAHDLPQEKYLLRRSCLTPGFRYVTGHYWNLKFHKSVILTG